MCDQSVMEGFSGAVTLSCDLVSEEGLARKFVGLIFQAERKAWMRTLQRDVCPVNKGGC